MCRVESELCPSMLTEFPEEKKKFIILVYGITEDRGYVRRNRDNVEDLKTVFSATSVCSIYVVSAT